MPKPKVPQFDASKAIAQQTQANEGERASTMGYNTIEQETPYGGSSYSMTIDPITGRPDYKLSTTMSPEQQALLENSQFIRALLGGAGGALGFNTLGNYTTAPDLVGSAGGLTEQALAKMEPQWDRMDKTALSWADNQARNSGILPDPVGTNAPENSAYRNLMDPIINQQMRTREQFRAEFMPKAFGMAEEEYQLPLMNIARMLGLSGPDDLKNSFLNTPTVSQAGVDAIGANKTAYEGQLKQFEANQARQNMLMNLGLKAASTVATGGLPVNPFSFGADDPSGNASSGSFISNLFK